MKMRRAGYLLLALSACEHSQPSGPGGPGSGPLPAGGTPVQLTYNSGEDRAPAWLPDGSGIVYSGERLDRLDRDACLLLLPPLGGQAVRSICHQTAGGMDSIDALDAPAVSGDYRLAYSMASAPVQLGSGVPTRQALIVGSWEGADDGEPVLSIPFTSPNHVLNTGVSHLVWLPDGTLVFLGEQVDGGATPVRTGLELMRLFTAGGVPTLTSIPNTTGASSVAAGGRDTIYYTLNGNPRVYRRVLSSGVESIMHTFGAIVRDATVVGTRLVAVVGGMVYYSIDPTFTEHQLDNGGDLYVVDLQTGVETVLPVQTSDTLRPIWFRRPSLSPDGSLLVADGRRYELIHHTDAAGNLLFTDTLIDPNRNLYEYDLHGGARLRAGRRRSPG